MTREYLPDLLPSDYSAIAKACKHAEEKIIVESLAHQKSWYMHSSSLDAYKARLFELIHPDGPRGVAQVRRESGVPAVFIDLMGFGDGFAKLARQDLLDCSLSICLGDDRTEKLKIRDSRHHVFRVVGNVFYQDTWDNARQTLQDAGYYEGASDIFWLPGAGTMPAYITDSVRVYDWLLHQAWSLLSEHHGNLYAEIPSHIYDHVTGVYTQWSSMLKGIPVSNGAVSLRALYDQSDFSSTEGISSKRHMRIEKAPGFTVLPSMSALITT